MLIIPLLVAVLALLGGRRSQTTSAAAARTSPAPPSLAPVSGYHAYLPYAGPRTRRGRGRGRGPSALETLYDLAAAGHQPSPALLHLAVEEARAAGRPDLLEDVVRRWIAPVVQAYEATQAPPVSPVPWTPWPPTQGVPAAPVPSPYQATPGPDSYAAYYPPYPPVAPAAEPVAYRYPAPPAPPGMPPPPAPASAPGFGAQMASPSPGDPGASRDLSDEDVLRVLEGSGPPRGAAPGPGPGTPGPDGSGGQQTVTVLGRSSPIEGVGNQQWAQFMERVAREQPTFQSAHHVGRHRQRLDRIVELGLDPQTVVSSPEAQDEALRVDMQDAWQRAHARGLLGYVGAPIEVVLPGAGPVQAKVTSSGVLGVVQAAGVEGALGWFGNPHDRVRYPNTTSAFLRTNAVF